MITLKKWLSVSWRYLVIGLVIDITCINRKFSLEMELNQDFFNVFQIQQPPTEHFSRKGFDLLDR